ncbi:MAG: hypothetical protein PVJ61_06595 [Dehalococcoidia bacterium]|jgi:hypothetical protein
MGKRRDLDKDKKIRRMLLEGTSTEVICEELGVSPSTVSRRRQELKVLAIQSQKQYDRHQEQLIEVTRVLERCIDLPEPAFMDIEDLYTRRRWGIEWEIDSRLIPRLSIPTEIQSKKCQFFGREVEIMPLFKAHTQGTSLWREFDKWGELGGEYVRECWSRLMEIRHRVSVDKMPNIPLIKETSEIKDGVLVDVIPQVCILPMFYWTIYSYPLRVYWSRSKVEYKTTNMFENRICYVSLCCDKDESSPNPIFRAPCGQKKQLIQIHQKLLKDYELVESLKHKFQEAVRIGEKIKKEFSEYITQESVPGTCSLCSDWVRLQRLRFY